MKTKFLLRIASAFILSMFIHVNGYSQIPVYVAPQVYDINPLGSSYPAHFANHNGTIYFAVFDEIELFKNSVELPEYYGLYRIINGNAELVKGDPYWKAISTIIPIGDYVYFGVDVMAHDEVEEHAELWRSNGEVTELIKAFDAPIIPEQVDIFKHVELLENSINLITEFNGFIYFSAYDVDHGAELWKSDGLPGGTTELLKDLHPGTTGSHMIELIVLGDYFYFSAGELSSELWISDGTEAGTLLHMDFNPPILKDTSIDFLPFDPENPGTEVEDFVILGTSIYFTAVDSEGNRDLWMSNPTTTSKIMVYPSGVTRLVSIDGLLYFSAYQAYPSGARLWKYGTEIGVVQIDCGLTTAPFFFDPKRIMKAGDDIFFSANDGIYGREQWVTDGITAHLLKNIFFGIGCKSLESGSEYNTVIETEMTDPNPRNSIAINNKLFFSANEGTGYEMWRSDGTEAGTVQVTNIYPGADYCWLEEEDLMVIDNVFYFIATDGPDNREMRSFNVLHFTTQPDLSTLAIEGDTSVSLTVVAEGVGEIDYQWQKDGIDIEGATLGTLTFGNLSLADSGTYNCIVSDVFYGDLISDGGVLIVEEQDLRITEQPAAVTNACPGDENITLTVVAGGTGILTYQWKKDGTEIIGANSALLEIVTDPANSGIYTCFITDDDGEVTTEDAVVTILDTSITTQPSVLTTVCENDTEIALSVVAMGAGTLTYQWKLNDVEIADSDSASLVIATVPSNSGAYICVVKGYCGEVISDNAVVNIYAATVITTQPPALSMACLGDADMKLSIAATGTGTLTYQWKKDGTEIIGATSASILIATDPANNGTYNCIVTGDCGVVTSADAVAATYAVTEIITQPAAETIACGDDIEITLSVEAGGSGTFIYQWKFEDSVIANSDSSTLVIANNPENSGTYVCVVTSDCGEVTSDNAVVMISATTEITTQPAALTTVCVGDPALILSVVATGTGTLNYQWRIGESLIVGAISSSLEVATYTSSSGNYTCTVTGDCGIVTSDIAVVSVNAATSIVTQPEALTTVCEGDTDIALSVVAGETGLLTYQWKLDASDIDGATSSSLIISTEPINSGIYTCVLTGDCGVVTSTDAVVTINAATSIAVQPEALTEVCPGDENITLSVVAVGTGILTYQWKKEGAEIYGATSASLVIANDPLNNGTYVCVVTSDCGVVTTANAVVNISITAITIQPEALTTVCEGDSEITLLLAAEGPGTLSYQWKLDTYDIDDATSSSLVIASDPSNSGTYSCVVTGDCGEVTSANAVVTIKAATAITTQPDASITACQGDENISLSVVAAGTGILTYQWKLEDVEISGANSSSLEITTDTSNSGIYNCVVTGDCGVVISSNAVVTINSATLIVSQPRALTSACNGDTDITLTVVATGTGILAYQWKLTGVEISGANSPSIVIATNPDNAGTYTCVVTSDCGVVISTNAVVFINVGTVITIQPAASTTANEGDADIKLSLVAYGTGTLTYQWKCDDIEIPDANSSSLIIETDPLNSGAYTCFVKSDCGSLTSDKAVVSINAATAIITQPDALTTVCEGDTDITLSVVACGTGTLIYQWVLNDTVIIGATYESLKITTECCYSGIYNCVVESDCGDVTSDNAVVTINAGTIITAQPISNEDIEEGSSITFSVVAEGADLTYQWRKDGQNLTDDLDISGVSTALLSITNVSADDEGEYDCVVTGYCGAMNSTNASLTIKNTTSLDDLTKAGVSIFPNPSQGKFTIRFDEAIDEAIVGVYDLVGKVVYLNKGISNSLMIDISDNAPGVYILKLEFDNNLITSKLIIE